VIGAITCGSKCVDHKCVGPTIHTRHGITKRPPISIRVWVLPPSLPPHYFLADTSSFDHECKVPTAETSGWCYLTVECSHRSPESCEGDLECHTGKGCFRLRQCDSHNDQGTFPPLQKSAPDSHVARTRWSTNWITSISGCPALMCVEPSTGGWVGEG